MSETHELCRNLIIRMKEIDTQGRAPEFNDYNLLWDAILDEIIAALGKEAAAPLLQLLVVTDP